VPFLIAVLLALIGGKQAAPHLTTACSPRARATLGRVASVAASSIDASRFVASNGAAGCRLEAHGLAVIVRLDSAPQAYTRMEREVVKFGQNVDWTKVPPGAYPQTVKHLGLDADWFPLQGRLLTTDGVRLITIKVRSSGQSGEASRKPLATRLAQIYLGPLVKPPGH
jgi:hypothetical protein